MGASMSSTRKVGLLGAFALLALLRGGPPLLLGPRHPAPLGGHAVGALRARLPVAGGGARGLLAQVHYPAEPSGDCFETREFEYFRPEVVRAIAEGYNIPRPLLSALLEGRAQVDASRLPKRREDGRGWPVAIFVSGLWGSCEMYTQLCRELAAAGAVVVALEHEDGSGIVAYDRRTGEAIDYLEQPQWPYDTVAFNEPFLRRRAEDLEMTIEGLKACVSGQTALAAAGETEAEAEAAAAVAAVVRCSDPEQLVLVGHSFGSASVLHCLRQVAAGSLQPSLRGALLLDFWPAPLSRDTSGADFESIGAELCTPFVLLQSEFWEGLEWYAPSCRRLARAARDRCLADGVVRGAFHHWVSDTHLWAPAWVLRAMKLMGPGEYQRVHRTTVRALHASLHALLEPGGPEAPAKAALRGRLACLDPEVLELVEQDGQSRL